jgi:hypothetical protein
MTEIPVLHDARTRDRYDTTWTLWPWEHPLAYWLRSNGNDVVCTRCGRATTGEPRPLDSDPEEIARVFVSVHLECPLGCGLRGSQPRVDPLFMHA